MIATEKQAKTKWCPQVQMLKMGDGGIGNNRDGFSNTYCIGSACMMWVWLDGESAWEDDMRMPCGTCGLINTRVGNP